MLHRRDRQRYVAGTGAALAPCTFAKQIACVLVAFGFHIVTPEIDHVLVSILDVDACETHVPKWAACCTPEVDAQSFTAPSLACALLPQASSLACALLPLVGSLLLGAVRAAMGWKVDGAGSCVSSSVTEPFTDTPLDSRSDGASSMVGRVWELSRCPTGSRAVLNAMDAADGDHARTVLAMELRDHVWEALECPYANYVLQKCILMLPPHLLQFIIDEIMSKSLGTRSAAQHRFGCRIIQRLLENCPPEQVQNLVNEILSDAELIARDIFGNYVLQHVLEYGAFEQQQCLLHFIRKEAKELSLLQYSVSVVAKALELGSTEDVAVIVRTLLSKSGLLAEMATSRSGYIVVKSVLEHAAWSERSDVVNQLVMNTTLLSGNKYGRKVMACIDSRMPPTS